LSFYGSNFIFDNKSLRSFGFTLLYNNENKGNISETSLETDKAQNSPFFNIVTKNDNSPLEFDLYFGRETKIPRYEFDVVKSWLQPHDKEYHKLYIEQDDLLGCYYNCVITKVEYDTFGNIPYCLTCHVVCDSQYVYLNDKVHETIISTSPTTLTFNNTSSAPLLYPIYEIKCNKEEGAVEINNTTIGKSIKFTGLKLNEIITIDTLEKTIKSSQDLKTFYRITDGYLNFIRLKQGKHNFTITGDASNFKIKYKILRKFGG